MIALSQLSRAVETRSDHRPMLSDLARIGQYRAGRGYRHVHLSGGQCTSEDTEKKGIAEIIVAKHRNGPVGTINLRFFERTARFADLELYQEPSGGQMTRCV